MISILILCLCNIVYFIQYYFFEISFILIMWQFYFDCYLVFHSSSKYVICHYNRLFISFCCYNNGKWKLLYVFLYKLWELLLALVFKLSTVPTVVHFTLWRRRNAYTYNWNNSFSWSNAYPSASNTLSGMF